MEHQGKKKTSHELKLFGKNLAQERWGEGVASTSTVLFVCNNYP